MPGPSRPGVTRGSRRILWSKDALEAVVDSWERSFDAANQGTVAFNRKLIEIAQRNINCNFDPAKSLAGAKNFAKVMELQAAYWWKQLSTITAQAEEREPSRIGRR